MKKYNKKDVARAVLSFVCIYYLLSQMSVAEWWINLVAAYFFTGIFNFIYNHAKERRSQLTTVEFNLNIENIIADISLSEEERNFLLKDKSLREPIIFSILRDFWVGTQVVYCNRMPELTGAITFYQYYRRAKKSVDLLSSTNAVETSFVPDGVFDKSHINFFSCNGNIVFTVFNKHVFSFPFLILDHFFAKVLSVDADFYSSALYKLPEIIAPIFSEHNFKLKGEDVEPEFNAFGAGWIGFGDVPGYSRFISKYTGVTIANIPMQYGKRSYFETRITDTENEVPKVNSNETLNQIIRKIYNLKR
jgi:hypothetical protein